MGNITLVYDNQADKAVLSGGAYTPELPLGNLQNMRLGRVARTVDLDPASTRITISLLDIQPIYAVVLGPTNLTTAVRFRLRGYDGESLVYESPGVDGWVEGSARAVFGSLPYGSPFLYDGYQPPDDPERGIWIMHVLAAPQALQEWTLEVLDPGNPAGYVEFGRLMIGPAVRPSINYPYGSNGLTFLDNSKKQKVLDGGSEIYRRVNPRQFNFGLEYLTEAEIYGEFYRFMQTTGFDREVFVIPDPDDPGQRLQRRSFLGTIEQMSPLSQTVFERGSTGFTITERI